MHQRVYVGLAHRVDIDGLRALAVLAVIAHHIVPTSFRSGFLGVDVFFVISGYLITQIIARDISAGSFTIPNFYERRVRRLLPAAALMTAVVSVIGYFCFMPSDLKLYGESLAAYALLSSNWYFATQADYFGIDTQQMPLLHTWSLSVEEQFYLLYPFLLICVRGYWSRLLALFVLLAASLSFNYYAITSNEASAFYNSLGRFWEIALGGLAGLVSMRMMPSPPYSWALRISGGALIAFGFATVTPDTLNYFKPLLAPTVGTAMLLLAGPLSKPAARLFVPAPVGYIGLISYGLYLWHWPILVVARMMFFELTPTILAACILLTFTAAALSFHLLEQPVRNKSWYPKRTAAFGSLGITTVGFCGFATLVVATEGLPSRLSPEIRKIFDSAITAFDSRFFHCFEPMTNDPVDNALARVRSNNLCRIGSPNAEPSFILWGDSHGFAALPAVDAAAHKLGMSGFAALDPGCPPLIGVNTIERRTCTELSEAVLDFITSHQTIDTVVLIARWSYYATGVWESRVGRIDADKPLAAFATAATATFDALEKKSVVFMDEVPIHFGRVPETVGRRALFGLDAEDLFVTREEYTKWRAPTSSILKEHAAARVLDPQPILCPDTVCLGTEGTFPLYWDEDHISKQGAALLTPLFEDAFEAIVSPVTTTYDAPVPAIPQ